MSNCMNYARSRHIFLPGVYVTGCLRVFGLAFIRNPAVPRSQMTQHSIPQQSTKNIQSKTGLRIWRHENMAPLMSGQLYFQWTTFHLEIAKKIRHRYFARMHALYSWKFTYSNHICENSTHVHHICKCTLYAMKCGLKDKIWWLWKASFLYWMIKQRHMVSCPPCMNLAVQEKKCFVVCRFVF